MVEKLWMSLRKSFVFGFGCHKLNLIFIFSFSMFTSPEPNSDLIFQDATQQLAPIEISSRHYAEWLGPNFMRARRIVDCQAAGTVSLPFSFIIMLFSVLSIHMWF